jgi:hypothetical protein
MIVGVSYSQSWQWGKRGGGSGNTKETIQSMATDSQKNIYATATVSAENIDIDGHALNSTDMAQNPFPTDAILTSFACDGSYRWSKIFTGQDQETLFDVHTDAQDNVYVAGFTSGGGGTNPFFKYSNYLDTDVTFDQTTTPDYFITFIVKYNSNGVMQWLKRIRPPFSTANSNNVVGILSMTTDSAGNCYALTSLTQGVYCDGALTLTGPGTMYYVIKYDANGNYIGATHLDFQTNYAYTMKFYRNHNNGNYYITQSKSTPSETATFGGQSATHDTILACFDSTGQFQWLREDATNGGFPYCNILNMTFDTNNDVYLALILAGSNNGQIPQDSFLGYSIIEGTAPVTVMKTNPNIDTLLWASRSTTHFDAFFSAAGLTLNNNEVSISSNYGGGYTWGTQTTPVFTGSPPLLARLDKTTGSCIGLSTILNNNQLNNAGTVLVTDASNDYIMGGQFTSLLYFNGGQQILNNGPQTDFFIAKYANQACSPMAVEENVKNNNKLQVYPNPTLGNVYFDNSVTQYSSVMVSNSLGQQIMCLPLTATSNTAIDLSQMSNGVYLLQFIGEKGSETVKVTRQ